MFSNEINAVQPFNIDLRFHAGFMARLNRYWRVLMSEPLAEITSLEQLKALPSALPYCHPDYKAPTPQEVDAVIRLSGLSQRKAALVTGVRNTEKGSPTIRRWKAHEASDQHREIPYAAWRLLLEYAGVASVKQTQDAIEKYC